MSDLFTRHAAQLLTEWFNQRYARSFSLTEEAAREGETPVLLAADGDYRLALAVIPLFQTDGPPGWRDGLDMLEARLSAGRSGAFLLWVPPGAVPPSEESLASDFVYRVLMATASLSPGERAEVQLAVRLALGKLDDEGNYVSVEGGLARWWSQLSEGITGSYQLDSTALRRAPADEEARQAIFRRIAEAAPGLSPGEVVTFEAAQAWTVQRLREGSGVALVAGPPDIDPTGGIALRRLLRERLVAANAALDAIDAHLKGVALVGIYEYIEEERAGVAVKAFDPALHSRLDLLCVLADGEVRPIFLPRSLPWAG